MKTKNNLFDYIVGFSWLLQVITIIVKQKSLSPVTPLQLSVGGQINYSLKANGTVIFNDIIILTFLVLGVLYLKYGIIKWEFKYGLASDLLGFVARIFKLFQIYIYVCAWVFWLNMLRLSDLGSSIFILNNLGLIIGGMGISVIYLYQRWLKRG
ncbi:hypothetical protein [Bombilactobacillus bombi]|uniref:hypothetical protein n=1 Tax=Bombilactobacillus bombi TaxID=1303590 RepID=UPI0015E60773|nr:hypothetical protein [Bombilactobacillus bombi]MBA1434636.1 hypothetical protein [Bombilactobacillus bombi]